MKSKLLKHIFICINERDKNNSRGDCSKCGGKEIRMEFVKLINQSGLKGKVRANKSGCLDVCELGAVVVIYPDNLWYSKVKVEDVQEIFDTSILKNLVVERLISNDKTWRDLKELREKD